MQQTKILYMPTRPAATNEMTFRQVTDWAQMSNDELIFALSTLSLHQSPYELDVLTEINDRIDRGAWIDIDQAIPSQNNLPAWLKLFPFCLFWKQRPG